jgi:hypothetical protein
MVNGPPLLAYASADPAALRPGEVLLWEGGALAPRRWWHRSPIPPAFRITNWRAFCVMARPRADKHRAPVPLPTRLVIVVRHPRRGPSTLELGPALWLRGLDDWRTPVRHLAAVPRPPRRRRRHPVPRRLSTVTPEPHPSDLDPHDLALLPDERVLWSGRPSPRALFAWPAVRHKLGILAGAAVPAAVLAWAVHSGGRDVGDFVIDGICAIWLLVAVYRLAIAPPLRRWQLARSRYVLTTRRAFAVRPYRGGRRITFVFLDALPATFVRQQWPDGFGDLTVNHAVSFERVADPLAVHAQLVDAVLTARRDLPDLGWSDVPHPADS